MRIGFLSDIHFGYTSGNRVNSDGVNVREQDFYDAGFRAVNNLLNRKVDIIVDGGDIAHVPAPKKRAIANLIDLINYAHIPFYSVDGNHTSLKSTSDIHLYDILNKECSNFRGFIGHGVTHDGIGMIPHSYDPTVTMARLDEVYNTLKPKMIVGHWAATDIQYDNSRVPIGFLPTDIPVFLGHFHKHMPQKSPLPTYIGSTERTGWDQWQFPTGASIYDTSSNKLEYVEHDSRGFVNLLADEENYLDVMNGEDMHDAIVRLTIKTRREIYGTLNFREAKRRANAAGSLSFTHRRTKDKDEEALIVETKEATSLSDSWANHIKDVDIIRTIDRDKVEKLGREALGD